MFRKRWAVVNLDQKPHQFMSWHNTKALAYDEASRRASLHSPTPFGVVELLGKVATSEPPIVWTAAEEVPDA